ncbi:MAG TPA: endonuclease/exonuclease/phosphatase family protein [Anaerolineae bacterium]|nr:endonuclease/exonuclease/phosphatase family protein [Anaerolineae bacterium]
MLRIATYNLYLGGTDRVEAIHSVLSSIDADVIALTEADDRSVVEELANRLKMHFVWEHGSGDRHIATLSRFPILASNIYRTSPLTQAVLETKVDVGKQTLTLYNAHFLPYLLLPFEVRRWQAAGKLLSIIRSKPNEPHIILGDLNSIAPGDRPLQRNNPPRMRRVMLLQLRLIFRLALPRLLRAGYLDCFRSLHPRDDGFTWMTGNRTTRFDYILANPIMARALRTCRVFDGHPALERASDHYPLVAEFDLEQL